MWYFSWILGVGFALACGIINAMWLEARVAQKRQTLQPIPVRPTDFPVDSRQRLN